MTRTDKEPYNLNEWEVKCGRFFTCGRPGRGVFGTKHVAIKEDTIDQWVGGLPLGTPVHIVSMLGSKTSGISEFSYYPFRSAYETGSKPSFQSWLDERYGARFVVHEFPTEDKLPLDAKIVAAIVACVRALLKQEDVVIVVDSAGIQRTGEVRKALAFTRRRVEAAK